ncbi:inactive protein kinase SELMODRAFT_444075 isoform X1 [Amborella trichopoda]|uniref:Protein kinase domain-containing protein n=1 Tax=Amborella trichopoda TaxID=13333 RepID=U5D620_AMBTC|nr:inactive protein kinase SELMODRAFT_444075 isoform X1 [Amborella trichopoda]XP_011627737.1 inactive protein kinase SELMODRAFT_444075 isoform X1 [Amborella trichopoda]XP_020530294.1 inactive protein kinase SELMODRAFT_444075 isoform X1 [Amborella trichopoda]ERN17675.1 hypothetical protein AMTR_s00059p00198400 [Amborella trichopoda]|eukprot:XP_006856208.1 inactive protein kinase SELMODRAFT_444075 isoform X1 [Amborella trichopoda]
MNADFAGNSSNSGEGKSSGDRECEEVMVAVKSGKENPRNALAWALTHVVKAGDSVTLVAVVSNENKGGRRGWSFPRLAGDCGSGHRKQRSESTDDGKCEISDSCSQLMLQLHGQSRINVKIKVVYASPPGAVALEAKRAGANWLVLDGHLKQEEKICMEELHCNIVTMKKAKAKVLRLNLAGVQNPVDTPDILTLELKNHIAKNQPENRMKLPSTPTSSPEGHTSPFSRTEAGLSSVSSYDIGASPFYVSETNPLFNLSQKGKSHLLEQERGVEEESAILSETDIDGWSPVYSQPWLETNQEKAYKNSSDIDITTIHRKPFPYSTLSLADTQGNYWVPSNPNYNRIEKPQIPKTLMEKFSENDQEDGLWRLGLYKDPGIIHDKRSDSGYLSSVVRDAVSLCRNSPSTPPPLCSICQHKAPLFGKPPRWFSYEELELATGGFSEANFLAEGGFGSVHRGVLEDGQAVAVKQHKAASSQGDVEFCSEVEVLSCAQHRNVVMLIGFCIEEKRRLLVYEYVCNGSLDAHLYGRGRDPLDWDARQKIAVGAARGLRYLHEDCRVGCIVHRDMRPNNILITHDFEPLVGDFGLARWQPDGDLGVDTRVIGTFGYLAPEYAQSGQITEKADVYAFGVVLVELITGRKAVDISRPKGQQCLTEWARPLLEKCAISQLLDPRLQLHSPHTHQQLYCMLYAASLCLRRDPHSRPRMSQVLHILEGDDPNYCSTPAYDTASIGSISGRLSCLSLQSLTGDSQPGHSRRLSHEALKAVYCDRGRSHPATIA